MHQPLGILSPRPQYCLGVTMYQVGLLRKRRHEAAQDEAARARAKRGGGFFKFSLLPPASFRLTRSRTPLAGFAFFRRHPPTTPSRRDNGHRPLISLDACRPNTCSFSGRGDCEGPARLHSSPHPFRIGPGFELEVLRVLPDHTRSRIHIRSFDATRARVSRRCDVCCRLMMAYSFHFIRAI